MWRDDGGNVNVHNIRLIRIVTTNSPHIMNISNKQFTKTKQKLTYTPQKKFLCQLTLTINKSCLIKTLSDLNKPFYKKIALEMANIWVNKNTI
jgi:hypothetical protein